MVILGRNHGSSQLGLSQILGCFYSACGEGFTQGYLVKYSVVLSLRSVKKLCLSLLGLEGDFYRVYYLVSCVLLDGAGIFLITQSMLLPRFSLAL